MNDASMTAQDFREYIIAKGWDRIDQATFETPYSPDPIEIPDTHIGTSARLSVDDVLTHLQAEVEVLKVAARLVASLPENAKLFDNFLTQAIGDE